MGLLGGIKKAIGKIAKTKVAGVSLGGLAGSALGPGGNLLGSAAAGGKKQILSDLMAGAANTAKIFPMAKALGGGTVTGGEPDADDGGYDAPLGEGLVAANPSIRPTPPFSPSASGGSGGPGGANDRYRSLGSFLPQNTDDWLDLGNFATGAYDNYQKGKLTSAGTKGLLNTPRPDLSSTFADPNDPQARYRNVNVGSRGRG